MRERGQERERAMHERERDACKRAKVAMHETMRESAMHGACERAKVALEKATHERELSTQGRGQHKGERCMRKRGTSMGTSTQPPPPAPDP